MLETVTAWMRQADPAAVYAFLFLDAFLENVIPPIPGDALVAFVGYLIPHSRVSFAGAVIASSAGSLFGFMAVFLLSRFLGHRLYAEGESGARHRFSRAVHKFFPPDDMAFLRRKFTTHGYVAVLVNRFLFGSRAVISVMAGLMHLNPFRVLLAAALSATIWNVLLLGAGQLLGSNWEQVGGYMAVYSLPITIALVVAFFFAFRKFIREKGA